jgi:uncharacterized integral membrane protein
MSHNAAQELIVEPVPADAVVAAPADDRPAPPIVATRVPAPPPETRRARARRMAHRMRLHMYAFAAVVLLVYVVALATTNTRKVRVDWLFAHSTIQLVWLTLFAAILGWLLGILITVLFRMRTREPRGRPAQPRSQTATLDGRTL